MRIRKKKWAQPELDLCPYYIKDPEQYKGKWNTGFCNQNNPTELEVGCGKGTFISKKALNNPDINYIALDIKSDMLGVARRTIEKEFEGRKVDNILLVPYNVEQIEKIFSSEDRIKNLYINFCNPWPRLKHKKRRLTYPLKLEKYYEFLTPGAKIYFKTDDDGLFEDSLIYFQNSPFKVVKIVRDLHNSEIRDNIMTEHEKMFSDEGIKIKYLEAVKQ